MRNADSSGVAVAGSGFGLSLGWWHGATGMAGLGARQQHNPGKTPPAEQHPEQQSPGKLQDPLNAQHLQSG
jgi:hypothetical protein